MSLTPTQQKVFNEVQKQGKATVASVAKSLRLRPDNAGRNLRFLTVLGALHVAEQDATKPRMPINVYVVGEGQEIQRKAAQLRQDAARKAFTKRNTYDPDAPVAPNTGWVSTIHSKDYSMNHSEHIRFMERFQPHPDHAAVWMFKQPRRQA